MATDNDNVIDIDGSKETERRSEPKKEEGKEGKEGEKGKQKTALYVVGFVFAAILGYLAYRYYENNIAGGTGSAAGAAPADSGSGAGAGGGAPVTPTPPTQPLEILTGGQGPITINVLGNGSPAKSIAHKVAGHAAGPKTKVLSIPAAITAKAKAINAHPNTAGAQSEKVNLKTPPALTGSGLPSQVHLVANAGSAAEAAAAKAIGAEEEANAHGHTANPIVHTVSLSGKGPAEEAAAARQVAAAAPKPAPGLSKFAKSAPKAAPAPAKAAPKAAPKPAPKGIAKRPA